MKVDSLVLETIESPASVMLPEINVTELPSKFLPYENGTVSYRPYTYGELLQFNQSKLTEQEQVKRILAGITTNFPKGSLSYFDFVYIGLLRKISTFGGDRFGFTYKCSDCGKSNTESLSASEIDFKDLEVPALPVIIDISETESLEVSTLTVDAYLALLDKDLMKDKVSVYASTITNMSFETACEVITSLTGEVIQDLEDVDTMLYIGIKPIPCTCSSCNNVTNVTIDEPSVLVHPFRGSPESTRTRIRFGKSSDS